MTHLIAYVDACIHIADVRLEVEASRIAERSVEGSPLHATMRAVTDEAEKRLFVAENEGMLKRDALIEAGRNGGVK